jgi:hypothetical protein
MTVPASPKLDRYGQLGLVPHFRMCLAQSGRWKASVIIVSSVNGENAQTRTRQVFANLKRYFRLSTPPSQIC